MTLYKKISALAVSIIFASSIFAQGDGPRSYMLSPVEVFGINAKWLNMDQNMLPASYIYIESADLKVNVFPTTLFSNFGIKNRFAQAQFMLNPGKVKGDLNTELKLPLTGLSASGFSDGFVASYQVRNPFPMI